jgi:hypothetical protein
VLHKNNNNKTKNKNIPSEAQPLAAVLHKDNIFAQLTTSCYLSGPRAGQNVSNASSVQEGDLSQAAPAERVPLVRRKIRVCRIDTGNWPEPESRRFIPCFSDAKVNVQGARLIVVDNVTRIRVYNMYDVSKPIFEHFLADPGALLGTCPVGAALRDDGAFCVAYPRHIVCGQITDGKSLFVIKLDKPVVTCVAFHEDHIVVGANHGSIYYYNATTGEPEGLTDTQWDLPVLGCNAQGPNMLVWDQRNAYRYHALPSIVAPYQFCASRPLGVAGCGSLLFAVSETGSLWMSDTIGKSGDMRQVLPPKSITKRFMLDKGNHVVQIPHNKPDVQQDFYRLCMPITYGYLAVACDRHACTILYPDGTCSRLTLEL